MCIRDSSKRGDYTVASYVLAFLFSWVSQFANQVCGIFISWIPHVAHNQTVVLSTQLSFSIGASASAFLPFFNLKGLFRNSLNVVVIDYYKFTKGWKS